MKIYENVPTYYTNPKGEVYANGSIHSESFNEALKRQEQYCVKGSDIANVEIPSYNYYTGNEGYTSCVQGTPNDPVIAAQNRQINFGMRYKSSCFDFTNQRDYDMITKNSDYSGMTNTEKYKAIYEKYQHCYGEKFLDALAISYTSPMQNDPYMELCDKFETEIAKVCSLSEDYTERANQMRQLRREALYGEEASDEQVRQSIMEKYPAMGEITFRDFYKMTNEMEMCGIGGHVNNWIGEIFSSNASNSRDLREAMLDTKVGFEQLQAMQKSYSGRLSSNISMHPDFGTVLNKLMTEYKKNAKNISTKIIEQMSSNSERTRASITWLKPQKA